MCIPRSQLRLDCRSCVNIYLSHGPLATGGMCNTLSNYVDGMSKLALASISFNLASPNCIFANTTIHKSHVWSEY